MNLKNGIHLTIASFMYMATGYVLSLWLGRYLGPARYGQYGVVITLMTLLNLIQTAGLPQAVAKFIAEEPADANRILKQAVKIQLVMAVVLGGGLLILSLFTTQLFGDGTLAPYIALSALVLPLYGLYSLFIGYYNGQHLFSRQALLNTFYSFAKLGAVIALTYTFGLIGAIIGFIAAPILALIFGARTQRLATVRQAFPVRTLLSFSLPLIVFSFLSTFMLSIDLFTIKHAFPSGPTSGYYVAVQNIALVPYLGLSAFAQMILPGIAQAFKRQGAQAAAKLFNKTLVYLLLALVPIITVMSAASRDVIDVLYSSTYAPGANALAILSIGYGLLTIYIFYANALNALGKGKITNAISIGGALLACICCLLFVPQFGMVGAAASITGGALILAIGCHIALRRSLLITLPFKLIGVLSVTTLLAYTIISATSSWSLIVHILVCCMMLALYGATYVMTGLISSKKFSTKISQLPHTIVVSLARIITAIVFVLIVSYVYIMNTRPFDSSLELHGFNSPSISKLGPTSRVELKDGAYNATDSPIYFSTKLPYQFDTARVTITYKNPHNDQNILVGYKDAAEWHYRTKTLDFPALQTSGFKAIGSEPYLFQKDTSFKTVASYLTNPPQDAITGLYNYTPPNASNITLPDYTPSTHPTTINTSLRGAVTFYEYVNNEPFNLTINKQDLNWYTDPDPMKITISKDDHIVTQKIINDDGNDTSNHIAGFPQSASLSLSGAASGAYKITIEASRDVLLTSLSTSAHKIAFESPLYIANNAIYGTANAQSQTLTTNASHVQFSVNHTGALQKITADDKTVDIANINTPYTISDLSSTNTLTVPKGDVIINATGFIAFAAAQLFEPSPFNIIQVDNPNDIAQADYVLTDYNDNAKTLTDGWQQNTLDFTLTDAHIEANRLSWMITAPELTDGTTDFQIKDVNITYYKKGWWQ